MNESRAGLVFFVALILANCSLNPGAAPPGAASPGGDIIRGPTPDVAVERPGGDAAPPGVFVDRGALDAPTAAALAAAVAGVEAGGTAPCRVAVPARVAGLLGDETSETAPCRAAVGAVEAHRDRYSDGSIAAGNVSIVYLSAAPATFVLVDAATGDETRVPLAAGTALRWPNERYTHRVDAPPGAARALLGPASRRGGGGLEGVGGLPSIINDGNIYDAVKWCLTNPQHCHPPIGDWDTSRVTNMASAFADYIPPQTSTFNADIGAWDTSQVTKMNGMFWGAAAFDADIGAWNVSKVMDMAGMFGGAAAFDADIGAWNVSAVKNMRYMFYGASEFDQDIGAWNTSSVTDMQYMFHNASAFNQDIGRWDTASVTDKTDMFRGAAAFYQCLPWHEDYDQPFEACSPTASPTTAPTASPTTAPTAAPTAAPTTSPTGMPTAMPTADPTGAPTGAPTVTPTAKPSEAPTAKPSDAPTSKPSDAPSAKPSDAPTAKPSASPTTAPTNLSQDAGEFGQGDGSFTEPDACSGLAKKTCKKTAGCVYKKKTCSTSGGDACSGLVADTTCKYVPNKKKCKKAGCRWNKKKEKCLAKK